MFSRRIQIGFSPRYALNSLLSVILIFLSSIQVFCNNVGRSRQLHRLFDRVYVDTNSSSELAYLVIEASEDLRELHLVNSWVYRYFFFLLPLTGNYSGWSIHCKYLLAAITPRFLSFIHKSIFVVYVGDITTLLLKAYNNDRSTPVSMICTNLSWEYCRENIFG